MTMTRRKLASAIALLVAFTAGVAAAQSGSDYDWQSGNSYNWSTSPSGSVRLRGFNSRTGSNWTTTIQPSGDMQGFDSRNGSWRYDDSTGFYQNFGTGRTCIGKGAARTCF